MSKGSGGTGPADWARGSRRLEGDRALNSPRELAVELQQPWRKLVLVQLLLIQSVLLQSPPFDRVRTLF